MSSSDSECGDETEAGEERAGEVGGGGQFFFCFPLVFGGRWHGFYEVLLLCCVLWDGFSDGCYVYFKRSSKWLMFWSLSSLPVILQNGRFCSALFWFTARTDVQKPAKVHKRQEKDSFKQLTRC